MDGAGGVVLKGEEREGWERQFLTCAKSWSGFAHKPCQRHLEARGDFEGER